MLDTAKIKKLKQRLTALVSNNSKAAYRPNTATKVIIMSLNFLKQSLCGQLWHFLIFFKAKCTKLTKEILFREVINMLVTCWQTTYFLLRLSMSLPFAIEWPKNDHIKETDRGLKSCRIGLCWTELYEECSMAEVSDIAMILTPWLPRHCFSRNPFIFIISIWKIHDTLTPMSRKSFFFSFYICICQYIFVKYDLYYVIQCIILIILIMPVKLRLQQQYC